MLDSEAQWTATKYEHLFGWELALGLLAGLGSGGGTCRDWPDWVYNISILWCFNHDAITTPCMQFAVLSRTVPISLANAQTQIIACTRGSSKVLRWPGVAGNCSVTCGTVVMRERNATTAQDPYFRTTIEPVPASTTPLILSISLTLTLTPI